MSYGLYNASDFLDLNDSVGFDKLERLLRKAIHFISVT